MYFLNWSLGGSYAITGVATRLSIRRDFSSPTVESLCSRDGAFFVLKIMAYCRNVGCYSKKESLEILKCKVSLCLVEKKYQNKPYKYRENTVLWRNTFFQSSADRQGGGEKAWNQSCTFSGGIGSDLNPSLRLGSDFRVENCYAVVFKCDLATKNV